MKSVKAITITIALAVVFSAAMYVTKMNRMVSVAAVNPLAVDEEKPDRSLCDRLIRYGQVAFERGQYTEAKHFFQKAIAVDPGYTAAWKKYNMALLALVSARVQSDPGFLPEFSSDAGAPEQAPVQISTETSEEDDGC